MLDYVDPCAQRVLIVDDAPDNLSVLHDALDEAGYVVFVATDGSSALHRAVQTLPDLILLDALMPGMDGFEVARRCKADAATQHIPIVFMTGLTETEHIVAAYGAGGVDYVTKPIRPPEVLARIAAHTQGARLLRQACSALDASGLATLAIGGSGRLVWQTPLARTLLRNYDLMAGADLSPDILMWIQGAVRLQAAGHEVLPMSVGRGPQRLVLTLQQRTDRNEWLVVLREESDAAIIDSLASAFQLTQREAEVLCWVARGKTSRDIGTILGTSPRTVNKHLEHVFEKLCVETRTAAAALALGRVRGVA